MFFNSKGLLGINARNLLYIRPYNLKKAIKLADDKIKTKQFLSARGVPVPRLYSAIKEFNEIDKFDYNSLPTSFVIKPNHGFGGEGIIPIINRRDNYWITSGGKKITLENIKDHIRDIIDGRFAIANSKDCAFFEQYIISDERVGKYSYEGLPDIRIVVHNLIPVMAMLRLPTKESGGKANLHQGAVAVGIDIGRGEATYASYKNKIIDELPNGLGKIRGLKIPFWDDILLIASKIQLLTNLGYLAVDICIDKHLGPVLLEINARAGLSVQVANLAPLRKRLERIQGLKVSSPIKGVRIAKDIFGNTVEKEIEHLSGKQIIGTEEEVEIIQKNSSIRLLAKIDTGIEKSIIDEETAMKAGLLENPLEYDDEKSILKVKFSLKNKRLQTILDVEKIPSKTYKMIIGSRDLKDFLIEPSIPKRDKIKKSTSIEESSPVIIKTSTRTPNFYEIDQKLIQIDNKIKLLYHLRPINLTSEKEKFFKSFKANPQFEYPQLSFDPLELIDELNKIETDQSPLGKMFASKKEEILNKIALLESIDEEDFTNISIQLFGTPSSEIIRECEKSLIEIDKKSLHQEKEDEIYSSEDAKIIFEKIFESYNLKNWKVKIKEEMVTDCVAGKNNRLFVREKAKFSKKRIESLTIHEIETHILTAENGKTQPYEIFNKGLAHYLPIQEGLAMYNVEKQQDMPFKNNYRVMANVIAINKALTSSFVDVFETLLEYGLPMEQAFRSTLKAKRGFADTGKQGALTKDYVYFDGYHQVKEFVEKGGDIRDLYIGKINLEQLENIKKIQNIRRPALLPKWLK
ncbi:MAG: tyrosine/phenylalanine carboxypeptidase domain-containing protein [Candidatus Gracilibacteria bacterium]